MDDLTKLSMKQLVDKINILENASHTVKTFSSKKVAIARLTKLHEAIEDEVPTTEETPEDNKSDAGKKDGTATPNEEEKKDIPTPAPEEKPALEQPLSNSETVLMSPKQLAYEFGIAAKTLRVRLRDHFEAGGTIEGVDHRKMQRWALPAEATAKALGYEIKSND